MSPEDNMRVENLALNAALDSIEELTMEKAELRARLRAAEEALRDIRWMHQEDNVSYRHLFLKAQARAAVVLDAVGGNTP